MAQCSEETTARHHHRLDTPAGQSWSGGAAADDDSELDVFAAERYFNGDDALWCARSSSSLSSSALRTGTTHERDRSVVTTTTTAAATSSSEASWNSRSVLLPEAKRALAVAPSVEADAEVLGITTTWSEQLPREKPAPSPPSHLRRWLLGVAGCACIAGGDGEDPESADDDDLCCDGVEDSVGGKKLVTDGAGELFQGRTKSKDLAIAEATSSARARPGSDGRLLDDGEDVLPGEVAAFSRIQLAGDDGHHRQAVKSGEFSARTYNPATTIAALSHEQRRRKTSEMLRPLGDTKRALPSARDDSANFTIVAGNMAYGGVLQAATGSDGKGRSAATPRWTGTTSRRDWWTDDDDDSAAPIELVAGCPYPPSEASVDWSVVTAEGVASCNFSSAASGYYYHLNGASRPAPGRGSNRRRRCGVANGGSLLTCMGGKTVDAVGPAPRLGDHDVMRRR